MRTIWKFPLKWSATQIVNFPKGAIILDAQMQGPTVCVWAVINDDEPITMEPRFIHIVGTGNAMPVNLYKEDYIGTVQTNGFVWHIFQELR